MSRRTWYSDSRTTSQGLVFGTFGFITTLIGTNPNLALAFGLGGMTGPDVVGQTANSGPTFVRSIVKTANAGEYRVTLQDGYRKVWDIEATVLAPAAGPADGVWSQPSVPTGEGDHVGPVTFLVTTLNAAGAPAEMNGRTIQLSMCLKDSGAGS